MKKLRTMAMIIVCCIFWLSPVFAADCHCPTDGIIIDPIEWQAILQKARLKTLTAAEICSQLDDDRVEVETRYRSQQLKTPADKFNRDFYEVRGALLRDILSKYCWR